jgi:hypothetical protein
VPSSALVVAIHTAWAVPGKRHIGAKASLRRQLTNLGENALPDASVRQANLSGSPILGSRKSTT